MRVESICTIHTHDPERRPCSLLTECEIEPGTRDDYKQLAVYHYRNTGVPPAIRQVYRAWHKPAERVVGAIVYAAPSLALAARNRVFGDYYNAGCTPLAHQRVNAEIDLISRVVVHPAFRGTGLGRELIAQTMRQRPYRVIEMSAAMGQLNPFAAKAGMRCLRTPRSRSGERVISALRSVGMAQQDIANPSAILATVERLPQGVRKFIISELKNFERGWLGSRTNASNRKITLESAARRVAANTMLDPMYCVYVRSETDDNPTRSEPIGTGSGPRRPASAGARST